MLFTSLPRAIDDCILALEHVERQLVKINAWTSPGPPLSACVDARYAAHLRRMTQTLIRRFEAVANEREKLHNQTSLTSEDN